MVLFGTALSLRKGKITAPLSCTGGQHTPSSVSCLMTLSPLCSTRLSCPQVNPLQVRNPCTTRSLPSSTLTLNSNSTLHGSLCPLQGPQTQGYRNVCRYWPTHHHTCVGLVGTV